MTPDEEKLLRKAVAIWVAITATVTLFILARFTISKVIDALC